jgi:hypothetical protein
VTTLISTGPSGGNGSPSSAFAGASQDGAHVFFITAESLVAADTDSAEDIYERSGGTTTLVSTGSSGNGGADAFFDGVTQDGARVFFRTKSSLVSADTDSSIDLYERSGGSTKLLSTGPSGGNGAFATHFAGASDDGVRVFFTTAEGLVSSDVDGKLDIYQRTGSTTSLISTGPSGGNGAFRADFAGTSQDGLRVFFHTDERLVSSDTDTYQDLYERVGSATTLLSGGPDIGNGAQAAFFAGASDDGIHVFFTTGEKLVSSDTDNYQDVYEATELTGYARPKGATPVVLQMVVAYKGCTASNGSHGSPFVAASCSPPVPESGYLTVGTADSNGQPTKSTGYMELRAICNPPAPTSAPPCIAPGEQGDVGIEISVTDVRRKTDLLDYTGELEAVLGLRITDHLNGPSLSSSATVTDLPYSIPVPCTSTADNTVGSSCNLTTSADAVLPGTVIETKRTIWELDQVEIRDGGADGSADTAPNTPFMRQGVVAP